MYIQDIYQNIYLEKEILQSLNISEIDNLNLTRQEEILRINRVILFDFLQLYHESETKIDSDKIFEISQEEMKFKSYLIDVINDLEFEYGVSNDADTFVKNYLKKNAVNTKQWLNNIFIENYDRPEILIGILRIIARIDADEINPNGMTMALAALKHKNIEVKECAIRAFENWGGKDSLKILEQIDEPVKWLNEYINKIISDLREERCQY